jgi:hypothetical protein
MVEFGLKLVDNRVSEWKEYYIDYETLQALLKKAAEAKDKLDDLKARDPELAARTIATINDEEDDEKRKDSSRIEAESWDNSNLSDNVAATSETAVIVQSMSSVSSSGNLVETVLKESGSSQNLIRADSSVSQWTYNKLFPQSGLTHKLKSAALNAIKKKKLFDDRLYEEVSP